MVLVLELNSLQSQLIRPFLLLSHSPVFTFYSQRQAKYTENKLKAIKARNEYLLALEATNNCVFKYYIHDLSDLIDVSPPLSHHHSFNIAFTLASL